LTEPLGGFRQRHAKPRLPCDIGEKIGRGSTCSVAVDDQLRTCIGLCGCKELELGRSGARSAPSRRHASETASSDRPPRGELQSASTSWISGARAVPGMDTPGSARRCRETDRAGVGDTRRPTGRPRTVVLEAAGQDIGTERVGPARRLQRPSNGARDMRDREASEVVDVAFRPPASRVRADLQAASPRSSATGLSISRDSLVRAAAIADLGA